MPLLMLGIVGAMLGAAGCSDDERSVTEGDGTGSVAGNGAGGAVSEQGGSEAGTLAGADSGAAALCECSHDTNGVQASIGCLCGAKACPVTFEADVLRAASDDNNYGEPYYVSVGTCDAGYRVISVSEAFGQQVGTRVYDAEGRLSSTRSGPFSTPPASCELEDAFPQGASVTYGDSVARDCDYCLLAGYDMGAGGAGSTEPYYEESSLPPCTPQQLKSR